VHRLTKPLGLVALAWFLAIYLPCLGKGFLKDDFAWIAQSRITAPRDVVLLFARNTGFYRPVVSLSFAADDALFDLRPLGYGLTNCVLLLVAGGLIVRLARSWGLPPAGAVAAAGLWALNPHGINMSLLWISGRTAILLTLFAVLAATAFTRRRIWAAGVWALFAMLSKEEAVVLPFILLAWSFVDAPRSDAVRQGIRARLMVACRSSVPLFLALLIYAVLRSQSGAMTPASAPAFYRFTFDWRIVVANAVQYVDRGATFSFAIAALSTLAAWRWPTVDAASRRLMALGAIWFVGAYALTLFLPVRSSLYACFPSVGAALIGATWITIIVSEMGDRARARALVALALVAALSVPVYWARNQRWETPATLSTSVLHQLREIVPAQPRDGVIVLRDRSDTRDDRLVAAFGTLLPTAIGLVANRPDVNVWVEPPPGDWALAGWRPPAPGAPAAVFVLRGQTLVPLRNAAQ